MRLRQVCLGAQLQEDDCASGSHGCWIISRGAKSFSACRDTFRGYVCQCPEGMPCCCCVMPSSSHPRPMECPMPVQFHACSCVNETLAVCIRELLSLSISGTLSLCQATAHVMLLSHQAERSFCDARAWSCLPMHAQAAAPHHITKAEECRPS